MNTRAGHNTLRRLTRRIFAASFGLLFCSIAYLPASAQTLGTNCTATLLDHTVPLNADGTYNIPNVPYSPGLYRIHIVCTNPDGTTSGGQSDPLALVPNGAALVPLVDVGTVPPALLRITITPDSALLSTIGATTQLNVIGVFADGTVENDSNNPGTTYTISNQAIATVSSTGLLTAVGAGVVTITARNDGLVATTSVNINALLDTDGDGMPDIWEIAHGLNPYDPSDAAQDPDNDGLTNLQEYKLGTDPHVADTDGDGLSDGAEVRLGTNPLVADTDGDGIPDGAEVLLGTNPLLADTDGDGIPDGLEVKLGMNPLVADATTTVVGRVIDGSNKPVAGVSVTVLQYFTATTDTTGGFTMAFVPANAPSSGGKLAASAIAVLQGGTVQSGSSASITAVPNTTTDLGLIQLGASAGTLTGTVKNSAGKTVAGAQVSIAGTNVTLSTTTGANGLYTATNLPAGPMVVSVLDPVTNLRGRAIGTMPAGSITPLTLNITLGGYGAVAGAVLNADGTPAASGITVSLSGSTILTTTTGALGVYSFPFVPLGAFTVQAGDTSGHTGSSSGFIAITNETITANIQFLGNGAVIGLVADSKGTVAPNATVTLLNTGSTPQTLTVQTDSTGHYRLDNVLVGSFAVSAGITQGISLGGTTMASLTQQGQTVTVNITLTAAGSAKGIVVRSDGTTPAAGVSVRAQNNAISTTTDSAGNYQLDFIPESTVKLVASDPTTSDQGSISTTVHAGTVNTVSPLVLNGVGAVHVTVLDASGIAVPSAQLTLTSDTAFTQQLNGLSADDGTYTFSNVLAGAATILATNPANQLAGTAQATVTANGSTSVTVHLQPAGTIAGHVYLADGVTGAAGVTVQLDSAITTVSAADGSYSFATVPSGSHLVVALDGLGTPASPTIAASISTQGQTVTTNLILVTRGTITGTIANSDASAAAGAAVTVQSLTAGFVRNFSTQTDIAGNYTIANVPAGPISVSAYTATASAQVTTTLPANGATTTVNLTLATNTVSSTQTLYDANGMQYDLDQSGEINTGTNSAFVGVTVPGNQRHDDALSLTLEPAGSPFAFTGTSHATLLQSGQEVAIEQDNLIGLNVTRRIFVPTNGYMARYIEALTNPTASDITVTVALKSDFRFTHEAHDGNTYEGQPSVVATSSGDAAFNITSTPQTTDSWLIAATDSDTDPFINTDNTPAVSYVFDGANASTALTSGSFVVSSNHSEMNAAWQHIRVPANTTVELMHFVSQQTLRSAAQASVQRLVQLPPEALSGLSSADASAILNFKVPANLTSTLPALPLLTGQVDGVVLGGDSTTPVARALVSLQSIDPIFARTYLFIADESGSFRFLGNVVAGTPSPTPIVAVPLEGFKLSATQTSTGAASPVFTGDLSPASIAAFQSIVFSNTGQLQGTVHFNGSTIVTNGAVTLTSGALPSPLIVTIQSDGTYSATGLPVGSYVATANISGTFLTGTATPNITAGAPVTADIFIPGGGILQGHILGSDAAHTALSGITVYLHLGAQTLSSITNSSGIYIFNDVPAGTFTVQAYDPVSNTAGSASTTVAAAATTDFDLTLASNGAVKVQLTAPAGTTLSGLTVTLTNATQSLTATTDANGIANFSGVAVGAFTASAAATNGYSGSAASALGLAGQTVSLSVVLGPHGTVNGTVFNADGVTPAAGIQVQLFGIAPGANQQSLLATTQTAANGAYAFNTVPVGRFSLYALNAANGDAATAGGALVVATQQVTVNITLTGVGTVTVTVLNSGGNPDTGVQITATSSLNSSYTGTTNVQGVAVLQNVLAGSIHITATDPGTKLSGQATISLVAGGQATSAITLQATATLMGHIYQPDGTSGAVSSLRLYLFGTSSPFATFITKADGAYQFTSVPLGQYVMNVYDANSVLRGYSIANFTSAAQTLTQDVTFDALGTVRGTVTNPDGSAAANIGVQLVSQNTIAGTLNTTADNSGNYSISGVPGGPFQVSAQDLSRGVGATVNGSIASDGDIQTVNIQLTSNIVGLTKSLLDFNGFTYDIQPDGSIGHGAFITDPLRHLGLNGAYYNAFHLALIQNGSQTDFAGSSTAVTSLGGNQLTIQQTAPIDGLTITRKVYVPSDGYFARYLEVLSNPGTTPVTIDVQVTAGIQPQPYYLSPITVTTSSGATTLSAADRTVVTNDGSTSNIFPFTQQALGEAFQGAGAPTPISTATYVTPTISTASFPQLTYRWNSITVPAGGQVSFLHFTTQQATQAQASASVARLDQLPPEGLFGLSTTDLNSIVNFAVPAGGTSQLQPLTVPAIGSVTGHLVQFDGTTVVPGGEVVFYGSDLYFGTPSFQLADSKGTFNFVKVPVTNYTLLGIDPASFVASPSTPGMFAQGSINSSTDVLFSNTGFIKGTENAPVGTSFTGGSVTVQATQGNLSATVPVAADGTFLIGSLLPATYNLTANLSPSIAPAQGAGFTIKQTVTVVAGQRSDVMLNLPSTGTISGVFTDAQGKPEASAYIQLNGAGFGRSEFTDSTGAFSFPQVPYGIYTLNGTDSVSSLSAAATVTVASSSVTQNLQIASGGTINLNVMLAGGQPAGNSLVTISRSGAAFGYVTAGVTDSSGNIQITSQPVGNFTITAYYPGSSISATSIETQISGAIATNGQILAVTAVLPAVSTITGTITTYAGAPVPQGIARLSYVDQAHAPSPTSVTASSTGVYTFSPALAGVAVQLQASSTYSSYSISQITAATSAAGGTLTANLKLPVSTTLIVTALDSNLKPLPGRYVYLKALTDSTTSVYGYSNGYTTDGIGTATFTEVPDATYAIIMLDNSSNLLGSATVTVHTTDDGKTLFPVVFTGWTGTVSGTLLATDGVTPVPPAPATITLTDVDSGNEIATYDSTDGTYTFPSITIGRDGYTVSAYYTSPTNYGYTSPTVSGSFYADGDTETTDITLPVPVVQGTIYQADGTTPAPNPNVSVTIPNYGNPMTFFGISDDNGHYSVAVPANDQASIIANYGGLTTQAQYFVHSDDTLDNQDITLHASGTVTGLLADQDGNPLGNQTVRVTSDGVPYTLFAQTDDFGVYTIPFVGTGSITVTYTPYYENCTATATGTLTNNGDTTSINVVFDQSKCPIPPGAIVRFPALLFLNPPDENARYTTIPFSEIQFASGAAL